MEIVSINGQIELLSGLHIGGGDDTMKIGGIDNSVIKDPNTNEPYIPGSSLKGKMRSLLEHHLRLVYLPGADGKPFNSELLKQVIKENNTPKKKIEEAKLLLKLFGDPDSDIKYGITRIVVSDCFLSEESKDMVLSEAKFENIINRQKGTAEHPRQMERVPAGVKFDFNIKIKVLEDISDSKERLIGMVKKGISLIEEDYLGGSGSRGYGRVRFNIKD